MPGRRAPAPLTTPILALLVLLTGCATLEVDDDAGDDDAGDDDAGDDDTAPLDGPGVAFVAAGSSIAGPWRFTHGVSCAQEEDEFAIRAAEDQDWTEFAALRLAEEPAPGDHVEQGLRVEVLVTPWWFERDGGGPDCHVDVEPGLPLRGTFACAGLHGYNAEHEEDTDLADGRFECPPADGER